MRMGASLLAGVALLGVGHASAGAGGEGVARWSTLAVLAAGVLAVAWSLRAASRRSAPASASFLHHVAELRSRLLASLGVFLLVVLAAFSLRAVPAAPFVEPAVYRPLAAQLFSHLVEHAMPAGATLVVLRPTEAFTAQITLALAAGAMVGIPVLLWQLLAFAKPALRPAEQRILKQVFVPAVLLFVAGAAFAYQWILPATFRALYAFAAPLGVSHSFLSVEDLVGFSAVTTLLFGLAFQTPLVMAAAARTGLVSPRQFLRYWRHSIVGIVVAAAFATPDGSPVTLALVAGPLVALYFLGAALSFPMHKRSQAGQAPTAP